ncbi:putative histone-like DNA-binding protein [Parabacteroides sp. PF5-5]|uniref:HU family DNA-binding protein n=1 Tax=unclassified Parabacteroides TaxID=2649774 RepID=UPI0024771CFB|nr:MULTISPECIES: HU family DNA-binding protein [unclassified Parabacteroides]MDH6304501.1 putative histone-like DNA-binding protein [Parabacteroides sp. PH5-39]MDH6315346.1 putative histone-like DNA-binding protein [Parabacteroides sp. PF5-13]MDH6319160.1 putative histone-like DNA-binding protein [Parabacteroides sp. PH5-13]MDH6322890.1 putative histone-like DNA-binding protein [Parabacteroides sp. PH5-8]MDH6326538.1 putative histone-like DNA-binding protein [Parabacteroides sp. PH5-41]
MSLKFRKVQRKVLSGVDAGKTKTYASAKANGYCDLKKLCKLISARSAMSSADVKAILDSLNWVMDVELQSGNIVQLGEFGNFRLSLSSEGTDKEEAFTASNIRKAKIVFFPGASLRQTRDTMDYEQEKPYEKEKECNRTHLD